MLRCLSLKSSSAAASASVPTSPVATTINLHSCPPHSQSQANSEDGTPIWSSASAQPSLAGDLTREYNFAFQTDSYKEIWSRIHSSNHQDLNHDQIVNSHANDEEDAHARRLLLARVLRPGRERVEEALGLAKHNAFTGLVSTCFDQSEDTTRLGLILHQSVDRARKLYNPLNTFLDVLPLDLDSLTQSQCNSAFDVFLQFDGSDNPFPSPNSHNFHKICSSFSQLKKQLSCQKHKSHSRIRLVQRATLGSVICLIGSTVAVAVSAVVIATHALVAIVACPFCGCANLTRKLTKKERAHLKQLDDAARSTFALKNDLDTIDCLVARLYDDVEGDKHLIRLGLNGGRDGHTILEVLKQLRKNYITFASHLTDLEEHVCLCFIHVNKARSLLLQEILLYQTSSPRADS
uniref:Uncharacterized protein MANES_11G075800 n=1 Tax=Rhizophora mucronata TaxID=61149 RepID=A0A2P2ISF3_RHIMU